MTLNLRFHWSTKNLVLQTEVAINKDHFDRKGRPMMELGGGESIKCIMEGNYIRILFPEQGYFGLNERSETAVFVKDKSGEDESLCLQFEWHEIPREEYISDRNLKQQPCKVF